MKIVCMDTSYQHILMVLVENDRIVASHYEPCFKKQSEQLLPILIKTLEEVSWSCDDIDEILVTKGPGSYTGVRVAMCVAKILCTTKQIALSCVSTLQLFAGTKEHMHVFLDARGKKVYVGSYHQGNAVVQDHVMSLEDAIAYAKQQTGLIYSDIDEIQSNCEIHLIEQFKEILPYRNKIKNVHAFIPQYIKEEHGY